MNSLGPLPRMTARDFPVTFSVQGLFDRFDHEIALPRQDDPIRFLTAPNGYGKSTLLRLLADLATENHAGLANAFWRKLKVGYESGAVLHAELEAKEHHFQELRYRLEIPGRDDAITVFCACIALAPCIVSFNCFLLIVVLSLILSLSNKHI